MAAHSEEIARFYSDSNVIPVNVKFKPVMKSTDEITKLCKDANSDDNCIGLITWCHTFSPSKMWINGLKILNKPILHLHTQYNKELPWNEIEADRVD